jgi:ABC-2 type transport system ATP-binding protein
MLQTGSIGVHVRQLSKRYDSIAAVTDLSFDLAPGRVTAFLGRNGAGKSTTLRMMLGLDHPTRGFAHFDGALYADLREPLRTVGALLETSAAHPGRTARNHLRWLAASNFLAPRRVPQTLTLVGLSDAADRRVRGFSLGMRQRLGVAGALLGDPSVLLLDEPANGLDAEGVRWLRRLLRELAAEGRTVLLSSHSMSEIELVADHLVIIDRGRLIADMSLPDFVRVHGQTRLRVRSRNPERLRAVLTAHGAEVTAEADGMLQVHGMAASDVGALAAERAVPLLELATDRSSLEETFLALTSPDQGRAA